MRQIQAFRYYLLYMAGSAFRNSGKGLKFRKLEHEAQHGGIVGVEGYV